MGTILAIFDLHVALILPTKFPVSWLLVQEKKGKTDFQNGGHLGFPIKTIFTIFILTSY